MKRLGETGGDANEFNEVLNLFVVFRMIAAVTSVFVLVAAAAVVVSVSFLV